MSHEPITRDPVLGDALAEATTDPMNERVNWTALRQTINARATSELSRRRLRRRGLRFALPASVAAGIALFMLMTHGPAPTSDGHPVQRSAGAEASIDELLDANVSDGQFRALLSGAGDADDLLLIAAGGEEDRR